ncbi:tryptophan halogenase family protein [Sphingomonas sp. BK235]|uniref:tryptophan halogenase family protein n=1 Tax=Sphingomonas sp. BK235 TaxID=2512131 RepID=UPI001047221C|nr:tryptophan halogenase family protein [Sphingomonas sp. BK235]TCP34236.1 tryptophan halogenase [Sphingomonas sp. BK235]
MSDNQRHDDSAVRQVVVVGGGSAGWIAACRLAAQAQRSGSPVTVTLVESARIPTVGVGEGTWPTMRNTLAKIGITETDFVRGCDAAFKQGARFVGWADDSPDDGYYHPLNPPAGATELDLAPHWRAQADTPGAQDFAGWVDFQAALCDAGLAPKAITMPEWVGQANYAYHLDAGKFATLLRDHAVERLGVRHVIGDVARVDQAPDGDITALVLADGDMVAGDLFVDCTGFAALLIGGVYGVPFRGCGDVLFADRAVALQVPYDSEDAPIACHTVATAQPAGWIWDIGLWTRRGVGHVYSSAHTSDDAAEAALRRYIGPAADALVARRITIEGGHRERFWQNNCVAVGLSAGFIEPLEASALMLIEASMDAIADRLPRTRGAMRVAARQFNHAFTHHWARIIEFLKLHYAITRRTDTDFWRDHAAPATWPDGLDERLALWRTHPPAPHDFAHAREVFSWPSYQYVLHGMGFATDYAAVAPAAPESALARRMIARTDRLRAEAVQRLPRHRDLLRAVREHGLQVV